MIDSAAQIGRQFIQRWRNASEDDATQAQAQLRVHIAIEDVLADPRVDGETKRRLRLARQS